MGCALIRRGRSGKSWVVQDALISKFITLLETQQDGDVSEINIDIDRFNSFKESSGWYYNFENFISWEVLKPRV